MDNAELKQRVNNVEVSVAELRTQTALLRQTLDKLSDLETRIHSIEMDVSNNKMLFSIVRWLAVTIGGSAIAVVLSTLVAEVI